MSAQHTLGQIYAGAGHEGRGLAARHAVEQPGTQ